MGPRPWKPAHELEGALQRGELDFAITLAAELAEDRKHVPLETALRFLPLVARERPGEYDRWALRWLSRWISETPDATIERAAETTASLSDLPGEPAMLERLRASGRPRRLPADL